MSAPRLIDCPDCNGEGWYIREKPWSGNPNALGPGEEQVECERCLGDGKIEREELGPEERDEDAEAVRAIARGERG